MFFQTKNKPYHDLKNKWTQKHQGIQNKLWEKHGEHLNWFSKNFPLKQIAATSMGGIMLLSSPSLLPAPHTPQIVSSQALTQGFDKNVLLASDLKGKVPEQVRALTPEEEKEIAQILSENTGFNIKPEIDGIRLNRTYGLIGGEQHLYRYPGDTLQKHADTTSDWAMYGGAGIAPGLGAWGYFAPSAAEFTEKDKQREKYYIAVQTFLAPGFAENVAKYRDFFKFRKMLVVNPKTGQAVVTVIGDAGPGESTGKHLGGSPEVMHFVGHAGGPRKGPVLYFFIDDPEDKIPLGPINLGSSREA